MIAVMKILLIVFLAISGIIAVRQRRSWGGYRIPIEQAKFFVSIRDEFGHMCGGAMISSKHVLTAAHCVLNEELQPASNLAVTSNAINAHAPGIDHDIRYIIYPPQFSHVTLSHDLAVLLLWQSNEMYTMEGVIEFSTGMPIYGNIATFVAYDNNVDALGNHHLHEAKLRVIPTELCSTDQYIDDSFLSEGFCSLSKNSEVLASTDLGGPLIQDGVIIGIASWIDEINNFTYYKNVGKFWVFLTEAKECLNYSCAPPICALYSYSSY